MKQMLFIVVGLLRQWLPFSHFILKFYLKDQTSFQDPLLLSHWGHEAKHHPSLCTTESILGLCLYQSGVWHFIVKPKVTYKLKRSYKPEWRFKWLITSLTPVTKNTLGSNLGLIYKCRCICQAESGKQWGKKVIFFQILSINEGEWCQNKIDPGAEISTIQTFIQMRVDNLTERKVFSLKHRVIQRPHGVNQYTL